jgi:hypothetical protein
VIGLVLWLAAGAPEVVDSSGCLDASELTRELEARIAHAPLQCADVHVDVEAHEQHRTLHMTTRDGWQRSLEVEHDSCVDVPVLIASVVARHLAELPVEPALADDVDSEPAPSPPVTVATTGAPARWFAQPALSLGGALGIAGGTVDARAGFGLALVPSDVVQLHVTGFAAAFGPVDVAGERAQMLLFAGGLAVGTRLDVAPWLVLAPRLGASVGAWNARGDGLAQNASVTLPWAAVDAVVRAQHTSGAFVELQASVPLTRVHLVVPGDARTFDGPSVLLSLSVGWAFAPVPLSGRDAR